MKIKKTLGKIALGVGVAAASQLVLADGLSGDVRYLGTGDSGLDYMETNLFYDASIVDASCFTFLDLNRRGSVYGKTACTAKGSIGKSGLQLKAQVIHNSRNGGVFSEAGFGVKGSVPLPKSVSASLDLTYFPLFKERGASVGETQKLEWFVKYSGELPLNASLSSFGGIVHRIGEGFSMEYGEVNLKVPISKRDSPFFVGYSAAMIPTGKIKPNLDHRIQAGVNFEF